MKKANEIDYGSIGFGYIQTPYNVRCYYRDGKWAEIEPVRTRICLSTLQPHLYTTDRSVSRGSKPFAEWTAR